MKRLFAFFICLNICSFAVSAQDKGFSFFGYHFGDRITGEELQDKFQCEVLSRDEASEDGLTSYYRFEKKVSFFGQIWGIVCMTCDYEDGFTNLELYNIVPESEATEMYNLLLSRLNSIKDEVKTKRLLSSGLIPDEAKAATIVDQSNIIYIHKQFIDDETGNPVIQLDVLGLLFLHEGELSADLQTLPESRITSESMPIIQNSFFGIKIGNWVTEGLIKRVIHEQGNYVITQNIGKTRLIICKDVYFAGERWAFAEFYINKRGYFYKLKIYDAYKDAGADNGFANARFKKYRKQLLEKYGDPQKVLEDDGEIIIMYRGMNNAYMSLGNTVGMSKGGDVMRYVTLEYGDIKLNAEVDKIAHNEL